ncbi:HAMP domain-containing histidine kinase [Candidatus Gracilibacteria bacterium]|nr:HAMP domain-containing histidine kinase [Candidatus Gracilibacteria bacterium]
MNYFKNLKTSERLAMSFALFGSISLIIFLILINITYFFIWYAEQKEMTFVNMEIDYAEQSGENSDREQTPDFTQFLLTHDTIIIPNEGELICSPGVETKIKEAPEIIQDKYFYRNEGVLYFIYSKYFPEVGEVKVLFDTTPYIKSQLVIIKAGTIFIILAFILQFLAGRIISRRLLKNLISISDSVKLVDINIPAKERIMLDGLAENDEIKILTDALNESYDKIDTQTDKLKQFITDVSHEFKTPLMGMSSRLDVLEKKSEKNKLTPDDSQKFFLDTRQNISKLNGLLESLFFLSRIEEEHGTFIKSHIHVNSLFESRILKISESFPHKNLKYNLDIEENLQYLVEEHTFTILIDNLISNAMKFAPENMDIKIKANETGFSVFDNGPGISEGDRQKIWEKFYRKDTNKEGFGVGLYLVKRITDMYDWNIQVYERSAGGTEFKVEISGEE